MCSPLVASARCCLTQAPFCPGRRCQRCRKVVLTNASRPPRRRDELPEDTSDNPDVAAIQAILDETSPEEAAEGFKVRAMCGDGTGSVALQAALAPMHARRRRCRTTAAARAACGHVDRLSMEAAAAWLALGLLLPPAEPGQRCAEDGAAGQKEVLPAPGHRAVRQGARGAAAALLRGCWLRAQPATPCSGNSWSRGLTCRMFNTCYLFKFTCASKLKHATPPPCCAGGVRRCGAQLNPLLQPRPRQPAAGQLPQRLPGRPGGAAPQRPKHQGAPAAGGVAATTGCSVAPVVACRGAAAAASRCTMLREAGYTAIATHTGVEAVAACILPRMLLPLPAMRRACCPPLFPSHTAAAPPWNHPRPTTAQPRGRWACASTTAAWSCARQAPAHPCRPACQPHLGSQPIQLDAASASVGRGRASRQMLHALQQAFQHELLLHSPLTQAGLNLEADNRELADMRRRAAVEKDAQVGPGGFCQGGDG